VIEEEILRTSLPHVLKTLEVEWPYNRYSGKVRESFSLPNAQRLVVTTDRLSAFDVVLTALPYKGQVLNQLSAFWFEKTTDIIPNHLLEVPDPNVSLVRECNPLPVEVIVRGYITGSTKTSLWTLYAAGHREIYGYHFPDGLKKNDPLPEPIITPTTKAGPGEHDERLTCSAVVERGFLDAHTWERVQEAALALFKRGQDVARAAGFCLVDTKYEFGRAPDGTLMLIDEVHTQGYRGDGPIPQLPQDIIVEAARRYITLFEGLTGQQFKPATYPAGPRIQGLLRRYLETP